MKISEEHIESEIRKLPAGDFDALAYDVFIFQYQNNELYRDYCNLLSKSPDQVDSLSDIPFLPIQFFKSHSVKSGNWESEHYFQSSGTQGQKRSRHYVKKMNWYHEITTCCFEEVFGNISDYSFVSLLPGYIENQHSSLIAMVDHFSKLSQSEHSGQYLKDFRKIKKVIISNPTRQFILFGVSFALLAMAESDVFNFGLNKNVKIIETGGMKGSRREMLKKELYPILKRNLGVSTIYSEYGMSELFAQSYTRKEEIFGTSRFQQIFIRDVFDPFHIYSNFGNKGGINMIDLSNYSTCSFIQTDDLGIAHSKGEFEVLGRLPMTELRGCNLLLYN